MATTDLERLVVQLSADVRGYQRSLDKARSSTNKAAHDIESRFSKMQGVLIHGTKELASGFISAFAVEKIVDSIGEAVKSMAELGDQAKRVGTDAASLKSLANIGALDDVSLDDITAGLKKLNLEVGKAQRTQKGPLFEIFSANGKKFSDDAIQNLLTLADLMKNAKNAQDRAVIGAAGLGKAYAQLVPLLDKGGDEIAQLIKKAIPDPEEFNRLVEKAHEFDDRWVAAWQTFELKGKTAVIEVLDYLDRLFAKESGFTKLVEHPGLFARAALQQATGIDFGAADQFRREILNQTDAQVQLAHVTEQILDVEKQIAEVRNIGGGSSPRLIQLGAELDNLKKQKSAIEDVIKSGADRQAQIADLEGQIAQVEQKLSDAKADQAKASQTLGVVAVDIVKVYQAQLEKLQKQLAIVKEMAGIFQKPMGAALGSFGGGGGEGTTIVPPPDAAGDNLIKATDNLLRIISKLESGNNPNIVNGGQQFSLITMSIREVLALQSRLLAQGNKSSAVGQFQITKATLEDFVNRLGLSLDDTFTPELQKKIAEAIIASTKGNPQALKGRFETLKGFSDEQLVQLYNQSADAIVRGNEALTEKQRILKELLATGSEEISQQQLENQLYGDTSLAAEKLRAEYEALAKAKKELGREPTPDERKQIIAQADALAELRYQHTQLTEAQKQSAASAKDMAAAQEELQHTLSEVGSAFQGALQGFIQDLIQGKSLTDALRDALLQLGQQLLQIGLNNLFGSLFGSSTGTSNGGILASIFHSGGVVGDGGSMRLAPASAFAGAPRFHSGRIPGLRNDEMAGIFKKGEIIFPDAESLGKVVRGYGGRGRGGGIVQNNTFIAPDWKSSVRSQNQIARTAGAQIERVQRTM